MKYLLVVSALLTCLINPAEARRSNVGGCIQTGDNMRPCAYQPDFLSGVRSIKIKMHREQPAESRVARRHATKYAHSYQAPSFARRAEHSGERVATQIVGGRPAGCPHAFCGCGASLYKFGRIIPELNLAWNWAVKFPRISAGEAGNGDAAVRRGHVAIVLANLGNGDYKLYDANSGGHQTRIHVRHLAGYIFVRPT